MLVLKRNWNQSVTIFLPDGRKVRVTVVQCPSAATVKLGFEADPDIKILREELFAPEDREGVQK